MTSVRSTNSSMPEINFGEPRSPDQGSGEDRNALVPTKAAHAAGSIASDISCSPNPACARLHGECSHTKRKITVDDEPSSHGQREKIKGL